MTSLEQVEAAVASLPEGEYHRFREWFLDRDWNQWDREIEKDSNAGKLAFLFDEAAEGKRRGTLRDL
jgi:hypothetical protein